MKGFIPGLFDRLMDEPVRSSGGTVARLSIEELKDSVARDLEALLNTRTATLPKVTRTVRDRSHTFINSRQNSAAFSSIFGVGFEVGYVLGRSDRTDQRVVLLYRADRRDQISRLIVGNAHPRCTVIKYENPDDLIARVSQSLSRRV